MCACGRDTHWLVVSSSTTVPAAAQTVEGAAVPTVQAAAQTIEETAVQTAPTAQTVEEAAVQTVPAAAHILAYSRGGSSTTSTSSS